MNTIKKRIHEAVSIVLLLSMSCMFMGCPSDSDSDTDYNSDSDSNFSELTATLKKYKWMSDAEYEFTDFTTWAELTKDVFVYYFMSDTEGVLRHYHKWIDSSGIADEGLYVSNIYFAYTVNGNTVNIRFIDSNFPRVTFTYDSNYLRSEDGDVLKAVVPSTGDWAQAKALFPQTGTTGECTYTYDPRTKEMVISGNGAMGDYVAGKQPWAEFPMEEVTIENGVTTIGNHAFYNIYTLQKVWISSNSNLRSIGVEAFAKSPIAFIDIPSKVEIIKEAAFSGCSNLGLIDFSKSTSLKTIETYAFSGVEKWQKKATGNYSGQQYYYKSLEVPASVESLGMVAFNGDIDEIVIGKNMRQMAGFAISTSVNNGKMYVNRGTPPTVNSSVLGERESSWTLYVPKGCKSAYQKDEAWKKFYKIIEDESLEKGDDYTGGSGDDNPSGGDESEYDKPGVSTIKVKGVSFKMIQVEGGTFQMGSNDGRDQEKPVHQVTLNTFSIGETEVTQELWEAVMGNNPSKYKGSHCPVDMISWDDCQEFIRKLNSLTGRNFRLPSEAEWEFAARGGNKSNGYIYSGSNNVNDVAWYYDYSISKSQDVATKRSNELGIYDMSGNVSEWCQDWHSSSYYSKSPSSNPTGPSTGSLRVIRGGSWAGLYECCRVTYRSSTKPEKTWYNTGMRLAL